MLAAIAAFPDQMRDGWTLTREADTARALSRRDQSVAVLGMGGSAICGDLVRAILADRLRVPLDVVRDYDLPAWVGPVRRSSSPSRTAARPRRRSGALDRAARDAARWP